MNSWRCNMKNFFLWIEAEELQELYNDSFVKSIERVWDLDLEAWIYTIEYMDGSMEEVCCDI
ncbi:TPA: hypothetical protein K8N17_000224 [Clostridium perfringens]|nr:hypothetical protein [Clostridium perfringens]HAT4127310.1 hypothetical protein [Clostridium perfringens]HBI6974331.1 hypothetical protein [Clostridium perfringens]HBI6988004.1 hypothetical protein [Clostridium perfringens]HBI6990965.1 hypothetical protein [Clostridium perfringens]